MFKTFILEMLGVMFVLGGCMQNASMPVGEPVLEEPTLRSLGAYWIIRGDENANARVKVEYRAAGTEPWHRGPDLFRVAKGHTTQAILARPGQRARVAELNPPDDCWILAGSILLLQPDTQYEIRLSLIDPDGGSTQRLLKSRTIGEPVAPKPERVLHVVPGEGGGSGTEADPFKGFAAAEMASKPGDLILIHKGTYPQALHIATSGLPGQPIIWRAAGDGEAAIDGRNQLRYGVQAWLTHDIWIEGLTIRNVAVGVSANESHHIVIRRNHIQVSMHGINFNVNRTGLVSNFFVSDNTIVGPVRWPRTKGVEDPGGMYMTGRGHDVCYNRVHGFADGIDTFNSTVCAAIDIHNNDISECTDDGSEMDFSERNTRNYENRYTNVFQGVSEQPIMGGPTYIFRNVFYNVELEPFKLHHNGTKEAEADWAPSGAIIFHNTIVKKGMPSLVWTQAPIYNCISRNNLYVGTGGEYACEMTCPAFGCDFDYDGFAGVNGPWPPWATTKTSMPATQESDDVTQRPSGGQLETAPATESATQGSTDGQFIVIKKPRRPTRPVWKKESLHCAGPFTYFMFWNGTEYRTLADVQVHSPAERHALQLEATTIFATGLLPPLAAKVEYPRVEDFTLKPGCPAIDAGQVLPGLNDGYTGKAPDLGAWETGTPRPHYGPRP